MFRPIRKKKNELTLEDTKCLLHSSRRAVIAVNGDDGYPYAVPINFLYCEDEGKIYFHGARVGHKVDSIKKCDKICFTVYGNESIKKEDWAPFVQSTVVFGRCALITDQERAIEVVRKFAAKYYPNEELIEAEVKASGKAVQMFEITIEHMSGKEIQEI